MARSIALDKWHNQVPWFCQKAYYKVGSFILSFCFLSSLFIVVNWQPICIYSFYTFEYRNLFIASQSKKNFLENETTARRKKVGVDPSLWSRLKRPRASEKYHSEGSLAESHYFRLRSKPEKSKKEVNRDMNWRWTIDSWFLILLLLIYLLLPKSKPCLWI